VGLQDDLVESFAWVHGHADIWPWFADAGLFATIVEALAEPVHREHVTKVVGIEARGFLLAGAVARELRAGVVPIRKPGAIFAGPLLSRSTTPDYRGRTDDLLIQAGGLSDSDRVLLVDDWIETGSQALTAIDLVRAAGAQVVGVAVLVDGTQGSARTRLPLFHALIRAETLGPSE
jgi:adenine phosphoribosyltransferase